MKKVGDYDVNFEQEIGRGSFSRVYKGHGQKGDVAVKVIEFDKLIGKTREIINEEICMMEMIKNNPHPNIVSCYDVLVIDKKLYIVMEFCDSGDFKTILKKPLKEKYAQFYFCQLANGLRYLDQYCIIHRDIKPKNILLTNGRRVLKIADFGFAKVTSDTMLHETFCGSPLYMSPEILACNKYSNKTDLWSVGMILYEMLFGEHPFSECETINELKEISAKKIIDIPPNGTKNKNISESCLVLLKKLLTKEVNERITWNEFLFNPWISLTSRSITEQSKPLSWTQSPQTKSSPNTPDKLKSLYSVSTSTSISPSTSVSIKSKIEIIDDYLIDANPNTNSISNFEIDSDFIFQIEMQYTS